MQKCVRMALDNVDSLANDYAASRPPYLTYKLSLYSARLRQFIHKISYVRCQIIQGISLDTVDHAISKEFVYYEACKQPRNVIGPLEQRDKSSA